MDDIIFGDLISEKVSLERQRQDHSGVRHLNRLSPALPVPGEPLTLTLTTSGAFEAARCWYSVEGGLLPAASASLDLHPAGACWDELAWGYLRTWKVRLPPLPAGSLLRYQLAARPAGSREWVYADNQARTRPEATEFSLWIDPHGVPEWARQALVYHIFLDRFFPGQGQPWRKPQDLSGFFGGTLRGVIEKLDTIQSFGFNTLWLSPLFASPSHHGYDATDLYRVEPRLGTNADLKELIDSAHARGLRLLLDFVANHWSSQHPTFQAALADERSPYRDWYTWQRWPDEYETYFNVRDLPQLNLRRGPARNYLLDCAAYWLNEGVDGFRLDYAYGPPHDFWTDFRRACRTARPDCWLFGEVVHTAPVQLSYAGRLDGTLDFLLAQALRQTFAQGSQSLEAFEAFLSAHEEFFPAGFSRPAFLDNHDMNRFLFLAGGDTARLKLGALALFTLSGPPIVYYGTEAGLSQTRPLHQAGSAMFEAARLPMLWGAEQDPGLVEYFRRLGRLRRSHPVLAEGARKLLHLDSAAGTYAYLRAADPAHPAPGDVLAAFNRSPEPRTLSIPLPGLASPADLLNDQPVRLSGERVEITLAPYSGAFVGTDLKI
jgi:cyclomaltodextrinase / maltogenic alpha-amylase / neopullulanase